MNPRMRLEPYKGKRVYIHDYKNLVGKEFLETIPQLVDQALILGIKEQLIIIDVTGVKANSAIVEAFKKAAVDITPVTKKMAVVGLTPLQRVLLSGVNMFSHLGIQPFETIEQAKEYLIRD